MSDRDESQLNETDGMKKVMNTGDEDVPKSGDKMNHVYERYGDLLPLCRDGSYVHDADDGRSYALLLLLLCLLVVVVLVLVLVLVVVDDVCVLNFCVNDDFFSK